jgi:putative addiction module component (TIGR02574 family)
MTEKVRHILNESMSLSDAEKAELAAHLISSLDQGFDEDADAAWRAEVERRVDDMEAGKGRALPWPEARRRMLGMMDDSAAA